MAEPTIAEKTEQYREIGKELYGGLLEGVITSDSAAFVSGVLADVISIILKTGFTALAPIGAGLANGIAESEDALAPVLAKYATAAVNDIFGTSVSEAEFSKLRGGSARTVAGPQLGAAIMQHMSGTEGALVPGDAAASKYVGAFAGAAIEDWFKGWFFEVISSLVPWLDVGKIEAYGGLGDKVSNVLGIPGVSRRVLRPLVDTTIVAPLTWHVNKTYRPKLLSAAEAVRQFTRKRWTREQLLEELGRQGYSDDRIEALIASSAAHVSAADIVKGYGFNLFDLDEAVQRLGALGYEEQSARLLISVSRLDDTAAVDRRLRSAAVAAYVDRRITRSDLAGFFSDVLLNRAEVQHELAAADGLQALNVRRLSPAEARAAVKAGILHVRDYRIALEREGYPPEDTLVLELLLRHELDVKASAEEHRRQALEERAREKATREAARLARARELEAERAADRRTPVAALEQAAIRGLVPIEAVAAAYAFDYDAEAVAVLVSLLEEKRAAYLDTERRRAEAEQRAARRGLSIADVRAGVLAGYLSLDDFRARLEALDLAPADVDVLTGTLAARLAARDAAIAQRKRAEAEAKRRSIDLGRFERLVRRGLRSVAEYAALLRTLGFDDGSIAGMAELLEVQIVDDTAARLAREAADLLTGPGTLTVSQFARGVVLGVKTEAEYERFLMDRHFNADALIVLLAEVRDDLAAAEAARAKRATPPPAESPRESSIATVRRAAQLGLISPDAYAARMQRAGYVAEDIALELELLLLEIADVQQRRAERDAAAAGAEPRELSLSQIERAVKAGAQTIEDYRAAAAAAGYAPAAAATLVDLLEREVVSLEDARRRHEEISAQLAARRLSLAQLEESVTKGFKSLDDFYAELLGLGYGTDDAELLASLLAVDLDNAGAEA